MLLCIAHDPAARLRDIAASLGISERSAHSTVTDLAEAGYLIRQKDGRHNRYRIQAHLPAPGPGTREPAIEQVLALFAAQGRLLTGPHPATVGIIGIDAERTGELLRGCETSISASLPQHSLGERLDSHVEMVQRRPCTSQVPLAQSKLVLAQRPTDLRDSP